jgi:hypothetical protein
MSVFSMTLALELDMFVSADIGNLSMIDIMTLLMGICVEIQGLFREG